MPHPDEMGSVAYKKAWRQHRKSAKTPASENLPYIRYQEKYFKAKFPPPSLDRVLDLATMFDDRTHEIDAGVWKGSPVAVNIEEISCRQTIAGQNPPRRAFHLPDLLGLVILPAFLSPRQQRELIRACLQNHARAPNENNLNIHYSVPPDGLWNEWKMHMSKVTNGTPTAEPVVQPKHAGGTLAAQIEVDSGGRQLVNNVPASAENFEEMRGVPKSAPTPSSTTSPLPISAILPKLRWSNIGHFYHWGTKSYEFDREYIPVPDDIRGICRDAVNSLKWEEVWKDGPDYKSGDWGVDGPDWKDWHETFYPDAGIINFYQLKDTLMAHVDRSELSSTSPLVSISLGQASIFLIGGLTRDEEAIPILLRSGDVVIMSGPRCRRAYHGVPRILEGSLPPHLYGAACSPDEDDFSLFEAYLRTARININVRQVFPPTFDYAAHGLDALKPKRDAGVL